LINGKESGAGYEWVHAKEAKMDGGREIGMAVLSRTSGINRILD